MGLQLQASTLKKIEKVEKLKKVRTEINSAANKLGNILLLVPECSSVITDAQAELMRLKAHYDTKVAIAAI